ncbi:Uncharacterised protein [uncultured archaeon]|nr:Uncharacterised protein [uncultured archaeon]
MRDDNAVAAGQSPFRVASPFRISEHRNRNSFAASRLRVMLRTRVNPRTHAKPRRARRMGSIYQLDYGRLPYFEIDRDLILSVVWGICQN